MDEARQHAVCANGTEHSCGLRLGSLKRDRADTEDEDTFSRPGLHVTRPGSVRAPHPTSYSSTILEAGRNIKSLSLL